MVLEERHDLLDFLYRKIQAAIIHKDPYFRPLDPKVET